MLMQDYRKNHRIKSDEVVFDHRYGGRIKWAWSPLTDEKMGLGEVSSSPIALEQLSSLSLYLYVEHIHSGFTDKQDTHSGR